MKYLALILSCCSLVAQTSSFDLVSSNTFWSYVTTNNSRLNAGTNQVFISSDQGTDTAPTFPTFSFIGKTNVGIGEVGTNHLGFFTGTSAPKVKLSGAALFPTIDASITLGTPDNRWQILYARNGLIIGGTNAINGIIQMWHATDNLYWRFKPSADTTNEFNFELNLPSNAARVGEVLVITNSVAGLMKAQWGRRQLTTIQTLDFPSIGANTNQDLTFTVTGAVTNDAVVFGLPSSPNPGVVFQAFVPSADNVTCRAYNYTTNAIDPASANYRFTVQQQ